MHIQVYARPFSQLSTPHDGMMLEAILALYPGSIFQLYGRAHRLLKLPRISLLAEVFYARMRQTMVGPGYLLRPEQYVLEVLMLIWGNETQMLAGATSHLDHGLWSVNPQAIQFYGVDSSLTVKVHLDYAQTLNYAAN